MCFVGCGWWSVCKGKVIDATTKVLLGHKYLFVSSVLEAVIVFREVGIGSMAGQWSHIFSAH